jgi:hypothetical protein
MNEKPARQPKQGDGYHKDLRQNSLTWQTGISAAPNTRVCQWRTRCICDMELARRWIMIAKPSDWSANAMVKPLNL